MYVPHCYVAAASNIDLALLLFSPLGLFLSLLDLWQCQSTRWYWKLVPVSVLFSSLLSSLSVHLLRLTLLCLLEMPTHTFYLSPHKKCPVDLS